jgi:hypothetical protein
MGKKTRYVPLDWSSGPDASSSSSLPPRRITINEVTDCAEPRQAGAWGNFKGVGGSIPESQPASTILIRHATSSSSDRSTKNEDLGSQETPVLSEMPMKSNGPDNADESHQELLEAEPSQGTVKAASGCDDALSSLHSCESPTNILLHSAPTTHAAVLVLQDGIKKLSLASDRSVARPASAETTLYWRYGMNEGTSPPRFPTGQPPTSLLRKPSLPTSRLSRFLLNNHSFTPAALASLPQYTERIFSRKPTQVLPIPGKIYFMPDGRHFPESIIHNQKQQNGFFQHPVLVVDTNGELVYFYAMTREPPKAIRELDMALRLGATHEDGGLNVLRLAPGSDIMLQETWVNLEQRFFIEWRNLDEWAVDVRVHPVSLYKITRRVFQLEAGQNRFIYKPLLRDMSTMLPGMVIMLPNAPNSSTLGAPVLVVENTYPSFRFLRVKRFTDNINFNSFATRRKGSSRAMSLGIARYPSIGHDRTPILFLEANSPEMREYSYVEVDLPFKHGKLDQCRTWCWPPVKISMGSMAVLHSYIANIVVRNPQPAYYAPPTGNVNGAHSAMPPPRYHTYQPQAMPVYPLGGYVPSSDARLQSYSGVGSGQNSM